MFGRNTAMRRHLPILMLILLAGCASPPAQVPEPPKPIELSYRLPGSPLQVGSTAAFQANIVVRRPFEHVVLALSSDSRCVEVDPSDFILQNLTPPAASAPSANSPPALPAVPLRLFKLKATCAAKAHLTLRAESDEAHASMDIGLETVQ